MVQDARVPRAGCTYTVEPGTSVTCENPDMDVVAVRYTFRPSSVGKERTGSVTLHPSAEGDPTAPVRVRTPPHADHAVVSNHNSST